MRAILCICILILSGCGKKNKDIKLIPLDQSTLSGQPSEAIKVSLPVIELGEIQKPEMTFGPDTVFRDDLKIIKNNQILRRKLLGDLGKVGIGSKDIWSSKDLIDYFDLQMLDWVDHSIKMQGRNKLQNLNNVEDFSLNFETRLSMENFNKDDLITDLEFSYFYFYPENGELKTILENEYVKTAEISGLDKNLTIKIKDHKLDFSDYKKSLNQNAKLVVKVSDYKIKTNDKLVRYEDVLESFLKHHAIVIISTKDKTDIRYVKPQTTLKGFLAGHSGDLIIDHDNVKCLLGYCQNTDMDHFHSGTENFKEKMIWYLSSDIDTQLEASKVYVAISMDGKEFMWNTLKNKPKKTFEKLKNRSEIIDVNPYAPPRFIINSFKEIPECSYRKEVFLGSYNKPPLLGMKRNYQCIGIISFITGIRHENLPWKDSDLEFMLDHKRYSMNELIEKKLISVIELGANQYELEFSEVPFDTLQLLINQREKKASMTVGFVGWEKECLIVHYHGKSPQTSEEVYDENHLFDIQMF